MSDKFIIVDGELYHYGVKGQKWGVRKDRKGSSSSSGPSNAPSRPRKYGSGGSSTSSSPGSSSTTSSSGSTTTSTSSTTSAASTTPRTGRRVSSEDVTTTLKSVKDIGNSAKTTTDHAVNMMDDISRIKSSKVNAKYSEEAKHISNERLQASITRMNLEKQYAQLKTERNTTTGEKAAKNVLGIIGKTMGIIAGAATTAVAVADIFERIRGRHAGRPS